MRFQLLDTMVMHLSLRQKDVYKLACRSSRSPESWITTAYTHHTKKTGQGAHLICSVGTHTLEKQRDINLPGCLKCCYFAE